MAGFQIRTSSLMMAGEDAGPSSGSSSRRRRRKRKAVAEETEEEDDDDEPAAPSVPAVELKPRDDTPVQLQIQDVREAVGGTIPTKDDEESSFLSNIPNPLNAFMDSSSSDDTTKTASTRKTSSPTPSSSFSSSSSDDSSSLEQLLEDARRMKEAEENELSDGDNESDGSGAVDSIKGKIANVLSTIVTVDFFVVCAFLVWFLAGIFCSSVLKDDTVQILFNNNFEKLVQPALGVLMIASIAGNFFKEEEEEVY